MMAKREPTKQLRRFCVGPSYQPGHRVMTLWQHLRPCSAPAARCYVFGRKFPNRALPTGFPRSTRSVSHSEPTRAKKSLTHVLVSFKLPVTSYHHMCSPAASAFPTPPPHGAGRRWPRPFGRGQLVFGGHEERTFTRAPREIASPPCCWSSSS
jgi:hypothetical protein